MSATFLTDPTDFSGDFDRATPNTADASRETGGERWSLGYNRVWGSAAFELAGTDHDADLNEFAIFRTNRNDVSFTPGATFSSAEELLGGDGTDIFINRATDSVRTSFEYLFDTGWGDHAFKVGIVDGSSTLFEDAQTVGNPPATFLSLNSRGTSGPIRLCEIVGLDECGGDAWSTVDFGVSSDEVVGFNEGLTDSQRATLLNLWDDNGNGTLDQSEILLNMTFGSTADNPHGLINYTRDLQTRAGPSSKGSESTHYYIQDSWQWKKWSVNFGLRAEDTTFLADNGEDVGTWDTEVAPRLSVAYDIKGDQLDRSRDDGDRRGLRLVLLQRGAVPRAAG
ncbi:MAG: hypothetical protein MPN21_19835 [Thermoanaerobaculia bacterium]|nr:hypothetical protein [Thermoanaerobaculia bacterium]